MALLFDYTNGFHDSASSISTIVATGLLRPRSEVAVSSPGAAWGTGWATGHRTALGLSS